MGRKQCSHRQSRLESYGRSMTNSGGRLCDTALMFLPNSPHPAGMMQHLKRYATVSSPSRNDSGEYRPKRPSLLASQPRLVIHRDAITDPRFGDDPVGRTSSAIAAQRTASRPRRRSFYGPGMPDVFVGRGGLNPPSSDSVGPVGPADPVGPSTASEHDGRRPLAYGYGHSVASGLLS